MDVLQDRARYIRPPAEIRRIFDREKSVTAYEELFRRLTAGAAAAAA